MNWLSGTRLWLRVRYVPLGENISIGIFIKQLLSGIGDHTMCPCPTEIPRGQAMRTHRSMWPYKQPKFCVVSAATAADLEPTTGNTGTTPCYTRRLVSVHGRERSALRFGLGPTPTTVRSSMSFLRHSHVHGNRTYMRHEFMPGTQFRRALAFWILGHLFCLAERIATVAKCRLHIPVWAMTVWTEC
jgi:hypothetical protein